MPAAVERGGPGFAVRATPNVLTLARLAVVPVTVWLVLEQRLDWACVTFGLAGLTDAVDGWLARRLGAESPLGAVLDPLADKALLVSVYGALAGIGVLPGWLAGLVLAREVLILGGIAWLARRGAAPAIRPLPISRLNTAIQVGVAGLALGVAGFDLPWRPVVDAAVWVAATTTLASGAAYARDGGRR